MTKKPISKLNELARFHKMARHEYLQALINREHSSFLLRIDQSSRPELYDNNLELPLLCSLPSN